MNKPSNEKDEVVIYSLDKQVFINVPLPRSETGLALLGLSSKSKKR